MRGCVLAAWVVVAGLLSAASASAQVSGGVKAGVNFADVSGTVSSGEEQAKRVGLVAGAFLTVPLADMIGFQPEVLYSMEGTRVKFTQGSTTFESTSKIDMIRVPLLLRVGPKPRASASGYLLVGPSLGFVVSAKDVTTNQPDTDFKSQLTSADIGILFGGGVTVGKFLAEARYTAGLRDLNNPSSSDPNKTRVFSILAGVTF